MTFWKDRIIFSLGLTKTLGRPVNDSTKSSFAKQMSSLGSLYSTAAPWDLVEGFRCLAHTTVRAKYQSVKQLCDREKTQETFTLLHSRPPWGSLLVFHVSATPVEKLSRRGFGDPLSIFPYSVVFWLDMYVDF